MFRGVGKGGKERFGLGQLAPNGASLPAPLAYLTVSSSAPSLLLGAARGAEGAARQACRLARTQPYALLFRLAGAQPYAPQFALHELAWALRLAELECAGAGLRLARLASGE